MRQMRIPLSKEIVEAVVEQRASHLEQEVRALCGPPHWLPFAHAGVDQMVHARFGCGGRNPPTLSPRASIVEEQVGIGPQIAPEAHEVAANASEPLAVWTARSGREGPYRLTHPLRSTQGLPPAPMPEQ